MCVNFIIQLIKADFCPLLGKWVTEQCSQSKRAQGQMEGQMVDGVIHPTLV